MPSDLCLISSDPSIFVTLRERGIQENVSRIPEASVEPTKENIDGPHRHCVFASLYRIKNVAMTDIPLGGTKLRNALKRINKHASNFANLLAQPFRPFGDLNAKFTRIELIVGVR